MQSLPNRLKIRPGKASPLLSWCALLRHSPCVLQGSNTTVHEGLRDKKEKSPGLFSTHLGLRREQVLWL